MAIASTRHAVGLTSVDFAPLSEISIMLPGELITANVEVASATTSFIPGFAAAFPDPVDSFYSCACAFINAFVLAGDYGIELRIDWSFDGQGSTPPWMNAITIACTPGVLAAVEGFRINHFFARVSIVNTNLTSIFVPVNCGAKFVTL